MASNGHSYRDRLRLTVKREIGLRCMVSRFNIDDNLGAIGWSCIPYDRYMPICFVFVELHAEGLSMIKNWW